MEVEAKRRELEDYFQLGMRMEDAWNRSRLARHRTTARATLTHRPAHATARYLSACRTRTTTAHAHAAHAHVADDAVAGGRPSARRIRRSWPTSGTRAFASEACAPFAPTP